MASSFRHRYWLPALGKAGLTGIHFHDLRHKLRMRSVSKPASTCHMVTCRTSKGQPGRTIGHVMGTVLNDAPRTRFRPARPPRP